ncbi:MAG: hypothetical protein IJ808_09525 [Muribaculaceae bacterium]|nr:hypothetical protein [Muribaculaceae bacterium]
MKRNLIFLIAGILVTIVFFLMREDAYNALYYSSGFNDQLWNLGLYETATLITIGMAWGAAAIYYYAINSVRFDRWWHWLAVLAVVALLTPIVSYLVISHAFSDAGLDYQLETFSFELGNVVWSALLFVVASFSMRWWSSNCRHTPIPQ